MPRRKPRCPVSQASAGAVRTAFPSYHAPTLQVTTA